MKHPRILLTGTYSVFNKGDVAMQISTAQAVKATWPDAVVKISSPFPELAKQLYGDDIVVESSRRNLVIGTLRTLAALLYARLSKIGIKAEWLIKGEELQAFKQADIVIDLSGDTLTEDYGPHVTYSHFLPLLMAQAMGKPVFACAQSIGPFKLTKWFSRWALNNCVAVTAREGVTYKYLRKLGVNKTDLRLVSDMAFLLKPSDKRHIDEILKKEKVDMSGKVLGVSLSDLVAKRYNASKPDSGDDFVSTMAGLLDKFVKRYDTKVVFVSHVTGPTATKNDRLIAASVKEAMSERQRAFVLSGDYRPEELKGIIARCDMMLGARMHANIGALSTGVPVVAIRYSHKTDGIMSAFKLGENVVDIDSLNPDKLFEVMSSTFENRKTIASNITAAANKVKEGSMANIDIIKETLNRNGQ